MESLHRYPLDERNVKGKATFQLQLEAFIRMFTPLVDQQYVVKRISHVMHLGLALQAREPAHL